MKKIILFLTIIFIFTLIIFSQNSLNKKTGSIEKINHYNNLIKINLNNEDYLIFTNNILNLKKGDTITLFFKKQNNENIVEKIIK